MEERQLELFEMGASTAPKTKAVYDSYDDWIAHFSFNPKTTDECWTPRDVYEAVLSYVRTLADMEGRKIVRPFFPDGNYRNTEYPDGCIVVDNPPFSMFKEITSFYLDRGILFFLFGPGLTIGNAACSIVITGSCIRYENGASVPTEFASNIPGLPMLCTAPDLGKAIKDCDSQRPKTKSLPTFVWPEELLSVSELRTIASGGVRFEAERCKPVKYLDNRGRLFGDHWLLLRAKAQAKAQAKAAIKVELSERERALVESLGDCGAK
jgi:hypothetical protein